MKRFLLTLALSLARLASADEELTPVVLAAVDIPAGTVVTMEMLSQRSVPRRLVTSSIVKPDSASYIVNQRIRRPMLQGDLMAWNNFDAPPLRAIEACEKKLSKGAAPNAIDQVRRARAAIIKR